MPFDSTQPPLNGDEQLTLENLREFERVLDEIEPHQFNMMCWMEQNTHCGTVGCLLGWAATDQYFKNQRLELSSGAPMIRNAHGRGYKSGGYSTGRELLPALNFRDVHSLFDPNKYAEKTSDLFKPVTKDMVRQRIHDLREKVVEIARQRVTGRTSEKAASS